MLTNHFQVYRSRVFTRVRGPMGLGTLEVDGCVLCFKCLVLSQKDVTFVRVENLWGICFLCGCSTCSFWTTELL